MQTLIVDSYKLCQTNRDLIYLFRSAGCFLVDFFSTFLSHPKINPFLNCLHLMLLHLLYYIIVAHVLNANEFKNTHYDSIRFKLYIYMNFFVIICSFQLTQKHNQINIQILSSFVNNCYLINFFYICPLSGDVLPKNIWYIYRYIYVAPILKTSEVLQLSYCPLFWLRQIIYIYIQIYRYS